MATRPRKPTARKSKAPAEWKLPPYSVQDVITARTQIVDWGVKLSGVPELWKDSDGEGIIVGVGDTGMPDHPDLLGSIVGSQDFTGSRFGALDRQGHATHCCGIVAAADNTIGTVGVAPKAKLLTAKLLGDNGSGSEQSVTAGIKWLADSGADVISLSLGSPTPSQRIRNAIQYAVGKGCFVVVAAGNSGPSPNTQEYPSRWPECFAVAAYGEDGRIADFSSRGPEVDIAAPGVDVVSTYLNGQLAKLSGTSMATPFVAGVAALLLSSAKKQGRKLTPQEVADKLRSTAKDVDAPGVDPSSGWGLVDPRKLLAPVPPTPPTEPVPVYRVVLEYSKGIEVKTKEV